jgi:hypothetical protein
MKHFSAIVISGVWRNSCFGEGLPLFAKMMKMMKYILMFKYKEDINGGTEPQ